MAERVELQLQPWQDVSSDVLGYTGGDLHVQTHRHTNEHGQSFNVLDVDARPDGKGPTVLSSTSFDYRVDPLLERKLSVYAKHTGSRVLLSELPGVTMDRIDPMQTAPDRKSFTAFKQGWFAAMGNYDFLVLEQLKAIQEVAQFQDGDEVRLMGESLGAYAVAHMPRLIASGQFEPRLAVTNVDLIEPVNSWGNHTLVRMLGILGPLAGPEAVRRNEIYLLENTQIGHGDITAFDFQSDENKAADVMLKKRQQALVLAAGAGLRKGVETSLKDAVKDRSSDGPRLYEADITVIRGQQSLVSHNKDLVAIAEDFKDRGIAVRQVEMTAGESDDTPIGHHALDSLGRMASFAQTLK